MGIYSTPWIGTYAAHIGSYSDNPDGVNEWIKKGRHNEHYRYRKRAATTGKDRTESGHLGPYSFVEADVKQWGEWGIDYLKYDWNPLDYYHVKEMHDALRTLDRDVVYSLSNSAPYGDARSGCGTPTAGARRATSATRGRASAASGSARTAGCPSTARVTGPTPTCWS